MLRLGIVGCDDFRTMYFLHQTMLVLYINFLTPALMTLKKKNIRKLLLLLVAFIKFIWSLHKDINTTS